MEILLILLGLVTAVFGSIRTSSLPVSNGSTIFSAKVKFISSTFPTRRISLAVALLCFVAWTGRADSPTESQQFGARRLDFPLGEGKAFIILPAKPAADSSKPWVWYAPTFIGHHPDDSHTWMAKQLLDAGFAIAGIEVGESYGSPAGRKLYSQLYDYLLAHYGLDPKPCLLPQSRGGLMLLNWAAENVDKVRCIAGIYAVCNIESYPGIDKACGAYGMDAATLRDRLKENNPIDRVKPLADAKGPMLFIHGDSDKVVPIETNAGELVKRCKELSGNASIIVVPGKGHEVCPEFFESRSFLDFLLKKERAKG